MRGDLLLTMKFSCTVFLLCFYAGTCTYYPITDCGSKKGKFDKISLSCSGDSECILKRNQNVTINIQFTPSEDVTSVTSVVHGIIEGLPVPFPIPNPNACVNSGLQCPLNKGKQYNYSAVFFVKRSYPKVRVHVKWEMRDDNKEDIICFIIPARIQ